MSRKHSIYKWDAVDPLLEALGDSRPPDGALIEISRRFDIPYGSITERRLRLRNLRRQGKVLDVDASRRWSDEDTRRAQAVVNAVAQELGRTPGAVLAHLLYLLKNGDSGANP